MPQCLNILRHKSAMRKYHARELTTNHWYACRLEFQTFLRVLLQRSKYNIRHAIVDHHQRGLHTVAIPAIVLHATLRERSLPRGHLVRVVSPVELTGALHELRLHAILRLARCPVEQALENIFDGESRE